MTRIKDALDLAARAGLEVSVSGSDPPNASVADLVANSGEHRDGFGFGVDMATGMISLFFMRDGRALAEELFDAEKADAIGSTLVAIAAEVAAGRAGRAKS